VIGLGKNLFYNSSMESCLLVCRTKKPNERKGKIIFINAINELRIERTNAWLEPQHIQKISDAYWKFKDVDGFAKISTIQQTLENNGNLNIPLYVKQAHNTSEHDLEDLLMAVKDGQQQIDISLENMFAKLGMAGVRLPKS